MTLTFWGCKDDCRRHGSVALAVASLQLEVVRRLRRQVSDDLGEFVARDPVDHPVTVGLSRIRRVVH